MSDAKQVELKPKVIYVELAPRERTDLDRLVVESGAAVGRNLSMSAVIRQLVRNAIRRGKPVRVQEQE